MTDPIRLQRQLHATRERADELDQRVTELTAALDELEAKTVTLSVRDGAQDHVRICRLEAAVVSLGVDLPVLGPVDAVVRSVAAGRLTANEEGR